MYQILTSQPWTVVTISIASGDSVDPAASGDARFWLVFLGILALAPFLLMMITSFVKLVVVGSILRSALGVQHIPPSTVITGLALILTIHIMWPVGKAAVEAFQDKNSFSVELNELLGESDNAESAATIRTFARAWLSLREPLFGFLKKHAHENNVRLFETLHGQLGRTEGNTATPDLDRGDADESSAAVPAKDLAAVDLERIATLVPAFVVSELTEAFQIGFLLFVPFLILDLVTSNLLLAMGMHMMAPTTISLPLKLLLFVLVDGWRLIVQGLVLGYV